MQKLCPAFDGRGACRHSIQGWVWLCYARRASTIAYRDDAVIGDCRSAALISADGSLDWLCLPRFDSPAVFASMLDSERGGPFQISPTHASTTTRRYIGDSNVLQTTFSTPIVTVIAHIPHRAIIGGFYELTSP